MVKIDPKNWFLAHFESSSFRPSYILWDTPQDFANWKNLVTLFRMSILGLLIDGEGAKRAPFLKSVTDILQW